MSSDSTHPTLADICIDISYGYTESASSEEVGPKFLRITDIQGGTIDWDRVPFCPASPQDVQKYRLEVGDIVAARTGNSTGENAQIFSPPPSAVYASYLIRFRPDGKRVNPFYVGYQLRSERFRQHVLSVRGGSAQPGANAKQLGAFPLLLIDRSQQDAVVSTLRALDNRITLLRETNATLEAIAQALFKSWFVDFDPVRAKMEGRVPEGMDEATAALFPDGFEESELGLVPKGWTNAPIYDMATFINGAAYKAFEPNAERRGRPIIKIAELKSGVTTQTAYSDVAMPDKYLIETGDILFSWSGNPDTSIDTFVWTFEKAWLNQHIFRVLPNASHERTFVLQMLRHLKPLFTELARNKQTTGLGHVTVADMKRELIAMPPVDLVRQFDLKVGPIHARIFENQRQAQTLSTLRDTLLPRLISGQLRLPEAQAAAAEALA